MLPTYLYDEVDAALPHHPSHPPPTSRLRRAAITPAVSA